MSHNVFPTPNYGDRRSNDIYDEKASVDMIDRVETAHTQGLTRMKAPELVRNMSPEERAHAEKVLVRKIDFRLMPMLVLMYIMPTISNYCYIANPILGTFSTTLIETTLLQRVWLDSSLIWP